MALDATGTPTSPDSIPKYNTAVDPPSGKGFNAAMDAIQVAISAVRASQVPSPASIASGEAPVWNGTAWVRSSVTRIGPSSLGSGTPDAATFLRGDGTWAGSWTSYTPAWTSSGVAPVLGNGVLTGRFIQIGKFVHAWARVVFGATTTFGGGGWFLSLPVMDAGASHHGAEFLIDSSPFAVSSGTARVEGSQQKVSLWTPNAQITPTTPWTWASGDSIELDISYEAA